MKNEWDCYISVVASLTQRNTTNASTTSSLGKYSKGVVMQATEYKTALWSYSWSDFDDPNCNYAQGTANLGPDGVQLTIPFGEILHCGTPHSFDSNLPTEADYLFGISQMGERLVLVNPILEGTSTNFGGGTCQTIKARYLLRARTPIDPQSTIESMRIGITGLREWAGLCPFSITYNSNLVLESINYTADQPERFSPIILDDERITIQLIQSYDMATKLYSAPDITNDCQIVASWKLPIGLEEAIDFARSFQQFINYCSTFPCAIKHIYVTFQGDISETQVHGEFFEPASHVDYNPIHMPFRYPDIAEKLPAALTNWLRAKGGLKEACKITVPLLAQMETLPYELRFVAACQAFEAIFHYDTPLEAMPEEKYRKMCKVVKDSVEDSEVQKWISERLPRNIKARIG